MKNIKSTLIVIVISIILIAVFFDFKNYILLFLNENMRLIQSYSEQYPMNVKIIFFSAYILFTSMSVPVALILGLLSGMLFDNMTAIVLVSFASAIGATFAFLISRYLFRDYLKNKYKDQYAKINNGIKRNSGYYIFALRMCVVFPFFLVNLLLGLTTIKTIHYYFVSQIGMLPATIIIVSLGNEIAGLLTSDMVIDLKLIVLLSALGLLPLISRIFLKKFLD